MTNKNNFDKDKLDEKIKAFQKESKNPEVNIDNVVNDIQAIITILQREKAQSKGETKDQINDYLDVLTILKYQIADQKYLKIINKLKENQGKLITDIAQLKNRIAKEKNFSNNPVVFNTLKNLFLPLKILSGL